MALTDSMECIEGMGVVVAVNGVPASLFSVALFSYSSSY